MTINVKGIASRNDTSGDWYWSTNDPDVVEHLNEIYVLYNQLGITYTDTQTTDGLIWVRTLILPSEATCNELSEFLLETEKGQEYIDVRNNWFRTHEHSLVIERYDENGHLVEVTNVYFH